MAQYIPKDALVAEIEKEIKDIYAGREYVGIPSWEEREIDGLEKAIEILNTLEVKEMPETAHTECKKIKKLCEIQRYDENGKAYSVMLPNTRLFMNKINDIIDAIDNIDSRLQIIEQKKEE